MIEIEIRTSSIAFKLYTGLYEKEEFAVAYKNEHMFKKSVLFADYVSGSSLNWSRIFERGQQSDDWSLMRYEV